MSVFAFTGSGLRAVTPRTVTKSAKKLRKFGEAETRKEKRARLKRVAQTGGDARERLWALTQLDEMAMESVGKSAPALLLKGGPRRELAARLGHHSVHASDPSTRLRAQERLRDLGGQS